MPTLGEVIEAGAKICSGKGTYSFVSQWISCLRLLDSQPALSLIDAFDTLHYGLSPLEGRGPFPSTELFPRVAQQLTYAVGIALNIATSARGVQQIASVHTSSDDALSYAFRRYEELLAQNVSDHQVQDHFLVVDGMSTRATRRDNFAAACTTLDVPLILPNAVEYNYTDYPAGSSAIDAEFPQLPALKYLINSQVLAYMLLLPPLARATVFHLIPLLAGPR